MTEKTADTTSFMNRARVYIRQGDSVIDRAQSEKTRAHKPWHGSSLQNWWQSRELIDNKMRFLSIMTAGLALSGTFCAVLQVCASSGRVRRGRLEEWGVSGRQGLEGKGMFVHTSLQGKR